MERRAGTPVATLKSNIVHAISDRAISHVFCGGRQVVRDRAGRR